MNLANWRQSSADIMLVVHVSVLLLDGTEIPKALRN